ncbi:MAG: tetratricopeptide repeat protein [Ignavibacteriae bacterium]|nr:tetratricopeptide repeat protein [Ignavibacteriota bacterium]
MKKVILFLALVISIVSANRISAQSIEELYESGRKAFYEDKFDEANDYFMKILVLDSDNFDNCYFKGLVYEINFDYENAIKQYSSALEFNDGCSECFKARGRVYEKMENYDQAISDYKNAIKYNDTDSDSFFKLASIYQDKNQYGFAVEYYSDYINMNPENDIAYYNRGLCYVELAQNDKAAVDFEKAIQIDGIWEKTLRPVIESIGY